MVLGVRVSGRSELVRQEHAICSRSSLDIFPKVVVVVLLRSKLWCGVMAQ